MKSIILAGGSGTRLWPLSRSNYPKQFLKLNQMNKSIFQQTIERCLLLSAPDEIYIVTNQNYKFIITGQIDELEYHIPETNILQEPIAKNTLPAIFYAVKTIQERGDDVAAVFASDHLIGNAELFAQQVQAGVKFTDKNIVIFGVCPISPETGYGYIKSGEAFGEGFFVDEFKEKPSVAIAEEYVRAGYLWNCGMFMFRTDVFYDEVQNLCPDVVDAFCADSVEECFKRSPVISIDYGIMEKCKRLVMLPLRIQWSDLGNFSTFYQEFRGRVDSVGNIRFNGEIIIDSKDNMIYSEEDKVVAVIGVNDLVVVDQKDALLICQKDRTQDVRLAVDQLKARKDPRADDHLTEYKPWGNVTLLEAGPFYKISHLSVLPGRKLPYQMHYHRSEHWVVLSGMALATVEGKETYVRGGENIFINSGMKHSLENRGKLLLQVIEVQSGAYLGQDDAASFSEVEKDDNSER